MCNFILLLIVSFVWVRSFSKMLPSVKFAEDFLIFKPDWSDKSEWYCKTVYCCHINLVQ